MKDRTLKLLLVLNLMVLTVILLRPSLSLPSTAAQSSAATRDNPELTRLMDEDQADRTPPAGKPIDWKSVGPRDAARLAHVKELYSKNQLQTGGDYYHAAMILQHGDVPEDYLLAHELCVAAITKGDPRAKWLAAASEDRFLMNIGRPQRFGTQYKSDGPNQPYRLYNVEPGVTDDLRRIMMVPSLAEAKAREAEMNKTK